MSTLEVPLMRVFLFTARQAVRRSRARFSSRILPPLACKSYLHKALYKMQVQYVVNIWSFYPEMYVP